MKTFILSLALLLAPLTAAHAYLNISPSTIEFGSVKVGTSVTQMFTITNVGTEEVQIQNCILAGVFQCQLNCFGVLEGNQVCTGLITFRPQAQRYELGTATVNTNKGTMSLSVHGFGTI